MSKVRKLIKLWPALALLVLGSATTAQKQVPSSNRCFTPSFWCLLPDLAPVGTLCYCGTPFGPVNGRVG